MVIMALDMEATEVTEATEATRATEVPHMTLEFTQGATAEPDMANRPKLKFYNLVIEVLVT